MVTRMREKGQITIPAEIRESLRLEKDSLLSIARVGDGILITPGPSAFETASVKFSKMADDQGITLQALLKDLKNLRKEDA